MSLPRPSRRATMGDGPGGGSGAAATRPERRPRDQDRRGGGTRPPYLSLRIGTKAANRHFLIASSVILISRPRFLHFTLNHHTEDAPRRGRSRQRCDDNNVTRERPQETRGGPLR